MSAAGHPVDFLGRFAQHVLPERFHKIRHYGLYASAAVTDALPTARALLAPVTTPLQPRVASSTWRDVCVPRTRESTC
ncbi:MAG: transposase [Polyangiaceae bacterium]|nr:transposase [Polyangiaceae bacterium]